MRSGKVLWVCCFVVAGAWLVLDLVVRDPWTFLFIGIALGSDALVRSITGGVFMDANAPVGSAARVLVCVVLFAVPGLAMRWLGARVFKAGVVSLVIVGWLIFYLSALTFLFQPRLPMG